MLGELIGEGRTAKIYAWEDGGDKIIKLFHSNFDYFGKWEAQINELIADFNLPVPTFYEFVETAGQIGVVFERVDGGTLATILMQDPEKAPALISKMAAMQVQVCSSKLAEKDEALPIMKEVYRQRVIENELLTQDEKKKLYKMIGGLPTGEVLCHADFHPDNILVMDGQWYVIDWLTANRGCLEADVARTLVTIRYGLITVGVEIGNMELAMSFLSFFDEYVKLVSEMADFDVALYERWIPVILAGRIQENNSQAEFEAIMRDLRGYLE